MGSEQEWMGIEAWRWTEETRYAANRKRRPSTPPPRLIPRDLYDSTTPTAVFVRQLAGHIYNMMEEGRKG